MKVVALSPDPGVPIEPMSAARAYREGLRKIQQWEDQSFQNGDGEWVNVIVAVTAKRTLERLAAWYGVTQRVILERLCEVRHVKQI